MRIFILSVLLSLAHLNSKAQTDTIQIYFRFTFENDPIQFNKYYLINNEDSLEISALKFYISNLALLNKEEVVWREDLGYHLIDAAFENTAKLNLTIKKDLFYDQLSFDLGIDSLTNVSGVMANDLDPSNNMYWTWQSGYINFKLEGRSNQSSARKNEFMFHIGGYQFPFNSLQNVNLKLNQKDSVNIELDLAKLISEMNLAELDHIMSPSKVAVEMSAGIAKKFQIMRP